jgi:hypothetical protein
MTDGGIGLDYALLQRQAQRQGLTLTYQDGYYQLTCQGQCVGSYMSLHRVEVALTFREDDDNDHLFS